VVRARGAHWDRERVNRGDVPGILAGCAIILAGLVIFATAGGPCSPLAERTSYIGGVGGKPAPTVDSQDSTRNPYALGICDHWPSTTAQFIRLAGLLGLLIVGALAAMQIGDKRHAGRRVVSVLVGIAGFVAWAVISV
jgi:hypothetical protein